MVRAFVLKGLSVVVVQVFGGEDLKKRGQSRRSTARLVSR